MSSSSSPTPSSTTDWSQFYQHNLSVPSASAMFADRGVSSDSTVLATSPTTPTPRAATTTNLNPEGRVTKPVRRRTRASRRTPTTLLNTDTTNFRAMVQQFTGGPSAPFASGRSQPPAATTFNFGLGSTSARQQIVNHPTAHLMVPSPSGYQIQFQQPQQQQQQQQYMFSQGNSIHSHNTTTSTHGDGLSHERRLGNFSRPNMGLGVGLAVSDHGFVMEGISSHAPPTTRPSPSNDNSNNNNYMF